MKEIEIREIIKKMTVREKIMLCMGKNSWRTEDYPEYGIPFIRVSDGTNGIRFQKDSDKAPLPYFDSSLDVSFDSPEALERTVATTCYPSGSAMACSWDKELMQEMGARLANECKSMGINVLLGPGMNIRRHPLTARNFEYYSEDPCLCGDIAAALVNGVQSGHVGTSVKHFACHNSDNRRTRVNVIVDERALREIYLAGFERVVKKANPATIMTSYNQINGIEMNENSRILRDIVRDEWNYEGTIVCDWGSCKDIAESTKGGMDLQMPGSLMSAEKLEKDIAKGLVSEELLGERAYHVLKLIFKYAGHEDVENDQKANHELSVKAAAESAVLLKNEEDFLPLHAERTQKIAIIGRLAKEPLYVGSGCAIVRTEHAEIPYDEIARVCGNQAELLYAPAYEADGTTTEALLKEAEETAAAADVVLVFAGSYLPGESDMYNRTSMSIERGHEDAIRAAARANENTAVILMIGDVTVMPWADKVKSVLCMWYGGEGMGSAAAQLLFGRKNPCGKLAVTVPEKEEDTPAYLSFNQSPYEMFYGESIYVGYRYYDKKKIAPRFPFGHGLSYTTFAYDNLQVVSEDDEKVVVSVDITNTGSMEGREAVQCYVASGKGHMEKPVRELKGFEKVSLKPGETKSVSFVLEQRDFSSFDIRNNEWVTDTPDFMVEIAASSRDIRQSVAVKRPVTYKPFKKLAKNCGFHEMFENEVTKKMFFDFAVEHGLLPREMVSEKVKDQLEFTFWSVRSYMDMNAHGMVTMDQFDELLDEMNKALAE